MSILIDKVPMGGIKIKRGVVVTDSSGNISVTFDSPFSATPIVIACALDGSANYYVTIRSRTASGFTGHVHKVANVPSAGGHNHTISSGYGTPAPSLGGFYYVYRADSTLCEVPVNSATASMLVTLSVGDHTHGEPSASAPSGVSVLWIAVEP